MAQARSHFISVDDTPYYRYVGRCVRTAFFCNDGKAVPRASARMDNRAY